jgi:predicted transposase/invertase (TIGR01784 family)
VVDTSREEGILAGIEKRSLEIAKQMKKEGESIEKIMRYTNLNWEEIEGL